VFILFIGCVKLSCFVFHSLLVFSYIDYHLTYRLTFILPMWRIGWTPNSIPIYIQQDATLNSLFISGNCSTCFGRYFHPSSEAHTTVSTASGICHTVTAICRYRGRAGTGLSVLWVAYATMRINNNLKTVITANFWLVWAVGCQLIAPLEEQYHNSKSVIFQEKF
jgi:hypothetical protein